MVAKWSRGVGFVALAVALLRPASPAGAVIYHGDPNLALAVSLVQAGTGPHGFSSELLFSRVFGPNRAAENEFLQDRYGFQSEAQYFSVMDYVVSDLVHIVHTRGIALPPPDRHASRSPAVLAKSLYEIGRLPDGRYDVGYMIERLMTHPIHHVIMRDIDARYSPKVNAAFHIVLTRVIVDGARGGPTR
jgi:hypothetical protein